MSEESGGLDLSHVTEVPGGEAFQNALNKFNKKAAGAALNVVKRVLCTVTEPFFRAHMGSRYYSLDTQVYGVGFWILGTMVAVAFPYYGSAALPLLDLAHLDYLARIYPCRVLAALTGCFMVYSQIRLGSHSLNTVATHLSQGKHYHTRSRGVPRKEGGELSILIFYEVILVLFDLPVGVLFLIGYWMNMKLKDEQDAAIMSRYLDAMDKELENQYLEGAALGECPTAMTYLNKPLSKDMNPTVRNGVAASLVGKPVLGIAKPRQQRTAPQSGTTQPPSATTRPGSQQPTAPSRRTSSPAPAHRQEAVQTSIPTRAGSTAQVATSIQPQSHTGQAAAVQRYTTTFSPEILELLQSVYGTEYAKIIVEMKAATPEKVPPDDVFLAKLRKMKVEKKEQAQLHVDYFMSTGLTLPEGVKVRKIEENQTTTYFLQTPPDTKWVPAGSWPF